MIQFCWLETTLIFSICNRFLCFLLTSVHVWPSMTHLSTYNFFGYSQSGATKCHVEINEIIILNVNSKQSVINGVTFFIPPMNGTTEFLTIVSSVRLQSTIHLPWNLYGSPFFLCARLTRSTLAPFNSRGKIAWSIPTCGESKAKNPHYYQVR